MTEAQAAVASLPNGTADIHTALDWWGKLNQFILDSNNLLIVFLFAIGLMLKASKQVRSWVIVYALPTLGALIGSLWMGFYRHQVDPVQGAMIGTVYGMIAIFAHNLIVHTLESPIGKPILALPGGQALADMVGADVPGVAPRPSSIRPAPNATIDPNSPKIPFVLMPLICAVSVMMSGCETTKSNPDGTVAVVQVSAADAAVAFLEKDSTKQDFKNTLVFAGAQIMDWSLTPEDKQAIGSQLWSWSVIFNSMQTGEFVTSDQLGASMKASAVNANSASVTKIVDAVQYGWSLIENKIKISGKVTLGMEYLTILSQAAQEVGAKFVPKPAP